MDILKLGINDLVFTFVELQVLKPISSFYLENLIPMPAIQSRSERQKTKPKERCEFTQHLSISDTRLSQVTQTYYSIPYPTPNPQTS